MEESPLAAEQRARALIDRQLRDAGWCVQSRKDLNLFAGQGVAVREAVMARGHGRSDYLLCVDQRAVGVIEAKPEGMPLSGVEWQSALYAEGLPPEVRLKALTHDGRLPFVLEASGSETHLTNGFDPSPRARRVFAVPRPETLARTLRDADADPDAPTWRARAPGRVRRLLPRRPRRGRSASSRSTMTSWSPGTRSTSTSPGCGTTCWRTSTTYRRPRLSPARSSRT